MFLLIHLAYNHVMTGAVFTFHDVSINTSFLTGEKYGFSYFTFHDVSINTGILPDSALGGILYIPRCFY